jgi:hypothetical protein
MKITFHQSGGFAGLSKHCELDTASMAPGEAKKLEQAVKNSGLEAVHPPAGTPKARDLTQYEIRVEQEDVPPVAVHFNDQTVAPQVYPLLQLLMGWAKPAAPRP